MLIFHNEWNKVGHFSLVQLRVHEMATFCLITGLSIETNLINIYFRNITVLQWYAPPFSKRIFHTKWQCLSGWLELGCFIFRLLMKTLLMEYIQKIDLLPRGSSDHKHSKVNRFSALLKGFRVGLNEWKIQSPAMRRTRWTFVTKL